MEMSENSDSDGSCDTPRKRKRGIVNKSVYKSEIIKHARVKGLQYTNSKGRVVNPLQPKEDCRCKRKCYGKISEEERLSIFDKFISFNTKNEQDGYLQGQISVVQEKQKRPRNPESATSKPHGSSYEYTMKAVKELLQEYESGKNGAICIDYMQNISLPLIPVQETFYLRQLSVSICCIHNLRDNSAHFIVYHEGVGGKGPNEVSTFLYQYVKENMGNVEKLHVFTDGCGGQNKNHTIVRVLSAMVSLGMFKTIEKYFPVRGHSFLPCDRDFAVLKRKIRLTDRVYIVKEIAALLLSSTARNKFLVSLPSSHDIIDFKKWWPKFYKKNMLSIESAGRQIPKERKVTFKVSQYGYFRHSHERDGVVVVKDFIDGLVEHSFNLKNSNKDGLVLPSDKAYPEGQIPITKKKMDDLQKLRSYLPQEKEIQEFYEKIYQWPITDHETDDAMG